MYIPTILTKHFTQNDLSSLGFSWWSEALVIWLSVLLDILDADDMNTPAMAKWSEKDLCERIPGCTFRSITTPIKQFCLIAAAGNS